MKIHTSFYFLGKKLFFHHGLNVWGFFGYFFLVKTFANGFDISDDFIVSLQALKRDIINTLSDRCEILFEDLILNEGPQKKSKKLKKKKTHQLIFAVNFGGCRKFCYSEVPVWLEQSKK